MIKLKYRVKQFKTFYSNLKVGLLEKNNNYKVYNIYVILRIYVILPKITTRITPVFIFKIWEHYTIVIIND